MARIILEDLPDNQRVNDEERKKALSALDDFNKYTEDLNQPRGGYNMGCGCGSYSSGCGCGCS